MKTVRPGSFACGILLLAALPRILFSQYQRYEGQKVTVIRFEPREQPLDAGELYRILPLKTGEPLSMETVRASIERLFATGRYADISVDAQPYDGGVAVTFLTRHSWFVGGVRAEGRINSPPGANQLANAGELDLGQPYTEAKLRDA